MKTRILTALAVLPLLIGVHLTLPARPAAAHNAYPARTYDLMLGPYRYQLLLYNEKVNAGDHVQMVLVPQRPDSRITLRVQARGPAGQARTADLIPDENNHENTAVDVVIPAPGSWRIAVAATSPAGGGTEDIPISVAPVPAIPQWAGWAIALSPLLGLAWFAVQQRILIRHAAAQGIAV